MQGGAASSHCLEYAGWGTYDESRRVLLAPKTIGSQAPKPGKPLQSHRDLDAKGPPEIPALDFGMMCDVRAGFK